MTGKELKLRRDNLNMTQTSLAEKLGTSTNTVARWEREEMKIQNPKTLDLALKTLEREKK